MGFLPFNSHVILVNKWTKSLLGDYISAKVVLVGATYALSYLIWTHHFVKFLPDFPKVTIWKEHRSTRTRSHKLLLVGKWADTTTTRVISLIKSLKIFGPEYWVFQMVRYISSVDAILGPESAVVLYLLISWIVKHASLFSYFVILPLKSLN